MNLMLMLIRKTCSHVWLRAPESIWFSDHSLCTSECVGPELAAVHETSHPPRTSKGITGLHCLMFARLELDQGPRHLSTPPTIDDACIAGGGDPLYNLSTQGHINTFVKRKRRQLRRVGKESELQHACDDKETSRDTRRIAGGPLREPAGPGGASLRPGAPHERTAARASFPLSLQAEGILRSSFQEPEGAAQGGRRVVRKRLQPSPVRVA